jgi:histidine triad (HIT) family protein
MEQCIFCQIVAGKIPCYKVYEDEHFLAFMDVFPRVKGHALVIPKQHYRWTYDVPEFGTYWEVVKKIALDIQKKLNANFISFLTMGEAVPHAHIHILPQYGKGIEGFRVDPVMQIPKEEIAKMAEEVKL